MKDVLYIVGGILLGMIVFGIFMFGVVEFGLLDEFFKVALAIAVIFMVLAVLYQIVSVAESVRNLFVKK